MIAYLNRSIILEDILVTELKKYFERIDFNGMYANFNLQITNEHPFARIIADGKTTQIGGYFPAIVVTTESDQKPPELLDLHCEVSPLAIDISDVSKLPEAGYQVTEKMINELTSVLEQRAALYGFTFTSRKKDSLSIEIWAENNQLKNELYNHVMLFLTGTVRIVEKKYEYVALAVEDKSIIGQRSNNYMLDFGTVLNGSMISVSADYCIEQSVIDSELQTISDEIILEVVNHVKGIG